ncbi:MAG TPA: AAA-like domain-containing protein [Blastocatellia bacterium]|nr:AAA-like domain-containing protein [Blastocatellia bacterium]
MSKTANVVFEFGPFQVEPAKRRVVRDGQPLFLNARAFDLLVALVERAGRVVTKDELIEVVWQGAAVEDNNLTVTMTGLRKALGEAPPHYQYIITHAGAGYQFIAEVTSSFAKTGHSGADEDSGHPHTGGAVRVDSNYYIVRAADHEFESAIASGDSIVLVKGPRQVGKTSLLARGLDLARRTGAHVALTDLQEFNQSDLETPKALYLAIAKQLAESLDLDPSLPRATWDADDGPNANLGRFVLREILGRTPGHVVWGMDEIDRLFGCKFAGDFFGLLRAWHNKRALDPDAPWHKLTLAIAYATEAHLFITDLNQSPFNVGTRLTLDDFTTDEVAELNRRYGSPLDESGVSRLYDMAAGHPYLSQVGLHRVSRGAGELEAGSAGEDPNIGDHLRRMAGLISADPELRSATAAVLDGEPCSNTEAFHRLRSAGVLAGDSFRTPRLRCRLYAEYLKHQLMDGLKG